ncbi:MAG: tautomerase family protein [Proteobacteria bacterium]|nr:tautomerase family protein [Pseudomonadota bacterium]
MPNVDIIALERHINGGWLNNCADLSKKLTDVFVAHAQCKPESVHIRFHPVDAAHYTIGGKLINNGSSEGNTLFEIDVSWYGGRPAEVQDAVAVGLTDAVVHATGIPPENVETNFRTLHRAAHYEGGKRVPSP